MLGEVVLGAVIWPTYVGVYDLDGREPWHCQAYRRSPIVWELIDGELMGRNADRIIVPQGGFGGMLLTHHPASGREIARRDFDHPLMIAPGGGDIDVCRIVQSDFMAVVR